DEHRVGRRCQPGGAGYCVERVEGILAFAGMVNNDNSELPRIGCCLKRFERAVVFVVVALLAAARLSNLTEYVDDDEARAQDSPWPVVDCLDQPPADAR